MRSLKLAGGGELQPGKLICLGRNYVAHARELKNPVPSRPIIFLKPASALIEDGEAIVIPPGCGEVHYEVELAVVVGSPGKLIPEGEAMEHVLGYAVMIDVTARSIQSAAKEKGLPWTEAKGYDTFAPLSSVVEKGFIADPHALSLGLSVNGQTRQDGTTADMIFSIPAVIAHVSGIMTLEKGDVIATGTPEGVGPLVAGDEVEAWIEKVGRLKVGVR